MYFFLPVCCREMLGSSTLLNVATRVLSMSHPEGPHLLAVQPRCSRQGSSGTAGSGNGAAKGASETRGSWGVEFRPPKAPASSTTIEASICSLHRHTSSELCNPMWHFLSRKRTSGFPALLRKPTLLCWQAGLGHHLTCPALQAAVAQDRMEGAPASGKNILVPLLSK